MNREKIEKFAYVVIAALFTCMIVFLFAVSIFGNSFVNHDEFTYYVTDSAVLAGDRANAAREYQVQ